MSYTIKWDKWQQQVLDHKGNLTLRTGRQVGKSEVVSEKAKKFAKENPGAVIMIIAASQRQSSLLFEKVHANVAQDDDLDFLEKPTLTKILLKNGSKIYCLPTGRTGHFIRGFTIDLLIADEAAFIPETVWLAVTPMLAVSKKLRGMGHIILLSTPFGKGGYFYNSFTDNDFRSFHVSSENCPRIPKDFLRKEKQRMTKAQYRQEYLGEFTDEWNQFFQTDLIKKCMTFIEWNKKEDYNPSARYYLGVDIARYGGDENGFIICELLGTKLKIVKCKATDRVSTTDTIGRITELENLWNFNKIFIDDGGVGGAITDVLIEKFGRKVMGINNASKRVTVQGEEKKRGILKEDLYSNTLMLMETGRLKILADLSLLKSMKSITFEYKTESGMIKIFGDYSHLTEALVRACWCIKERGLDIYCF
jgi:hypothetical protein|tara:strand:+ start:513 stop:1772 length:1260 start_codon:yes stop_codon:yes gene_type:complete